MPLELAEDQQAVRDQLKEQGRVLFLVADDAMLLRQNLKESKARLKIQLAGYVNFVVPEFV